MGGVAHRSPNPSANKNILQVSPTYDNLEFLFGENNTRLEESLVAVEVGDGLFAGVGDIMVAVDEEEVEDG